MNDLAELLKRAMEVYRAMPDEDKKEMWAKQRRSWVVSEMLFDHPERNREEVEALYDRLLAEGRLGA